MLSKFEIQGFQIAAVCGILVVMAGCAPARFPAPVESRAVSKSKTVTKQGASEIRARSNEPVPDGFYRIQRGDTLIGISLDHGVSWRDLADWNDITNPNMIEVDQLIRIRPAGAPRMASAPMTSPSASPQSTAPAVTEVRPIGSQTKPTSVATPSSGSAMLSWPSNGRVITQFADPGYKGIAFGGQEGDPVLAAGDGRVVYSGSGLRGYGNLVIVKHDGDFLTAYAHNRKILVTEGQSVKRGQQIAELGSTDSDTPKLHFEVRLSGKPVDPMRYLAQR